jgi:xanthine dehydrogenase YagT iron-sulfur-binding subunit
MNALPTSITRRVLGIASAVTAALGHELNALARAPERAPLVMMKVRLTVNDQPYELELDPRTSLLDALRDHLDLTGAKKGCDHGQCGACTVLVNGVRMNACMSLAVAREGDRIVTIEGLSEDEALNPMQQAFVAHDGFQCGFCTPGQICSAVGMLNEIETGMPSAVTADLTAAPPASAEEIRERMSGNICRCAAYPNIIAAILQAKGAPG